MFPRKERNVMPREVYELVTYKRLKTNSLNLLHKMFMWNNHKVVILSKVLEGRNIKELDQSYLCTKAGKIC